MRCQVCGDDYEDGVTHCAECDVPLGLTPDPRPHIDALLGRFSPLILDPLVRLLEHRGIEHERFTTGDGEEILVAASVRDGLRSELVVAWPDLVAALDRDQTFEVLEEGGSLPGWRDAPQGAWIDRAGRLQVDVTDDERLEQDARRVFGPALSLLGAVLLLFAWYVGGDSTAPLAVFGVGSLGLGLLLPK